MGDTSPRQDVDIQCKEETLSESGSLEIDEDQGSRCSRNEVVVPVQPNVEGRSCSRLTKTGAVKPSTKEDRGGDGSDGTRNTLPVPEGKSSKGKRKRTEEQKRVHRERQRYRRKMMSDEERREEYAKGQRWRQAQTEKLLKNDEERERRQGGDKEKIGMLEENDEIGKGMEEMRFERNMKQYLWRHARWANKEVRSKDHRRSGLRKAAKLLEETPEEREKRLEKQRQKYKMTRANMTQEQTERYRATILRCQERRAQFVQVQKYADYPEEKKEKIKKRLRDKLKEETPEEREQRLARYKRYQTRRRELVRLQEEEGMTKDDAEHLLRSTRPDLFTAFQLSTGKLRVHKRKEVTGSGKPYKPRSIPGCAPGRPPRRPDEVLEFIAEQKKKASHARAPNNTDTDKSISSSQKGSADADDNAKAALHEPTSCTIVSKPVQESIDAPELRSELLKKESNFQRPSTSLPSRSSEEIGQVAAGELVHRKIIPKVYGDSSKKVKKAGKKMLGGLIPVVLVSSTSSLIASSTLQSTSLDPLESERTLGEPDSQDYEKLKTSKKTSHVPATDKTTASVTSMDCSISEDSVIKTSPHVSPAHSFQDDLMAYSGEDESCDQCSDSEEKWSASSVHPVDIEINCNLGNQKPSASADEEFETVEAQTQTSSHKPSSQQRENYCELCKKQLRSQYIYRVHMEAKHAFSVDTNQSFEPKKFQCPFENCLKTFDHSQYLWDHYLRCHNDAASYDPNSQNKQKQHQVERDPNNGLCSYCGKNYFDWPSVVRHIKLVHENTESTFVCEHCVKTFKQKCTLDDHVRREHLGMDSACDICGRKFQCTVKLWRHKVKIHNMEDLDPTSLGKVQQQCLYCGIQMFRGMKPHVEKEHPEHLNEYLMALEIERKEKAKMRKRPGRIRIRAKSKNNYYPCTVCSQSFTRDWNLELHKRRFHPESLPAEITANVVNCDKCQRKFAARNGLIVHIFNHHYHVTKFSLDGVPNLETGQPRCQFCTFVLPDKVMYKLHVLTEHAEDFLQLFKQKLDEEISKQLKCPYCDEATITDREMLVHIRKNHPKKSKLDEESSKQLKCRNCPYCDKTTITEREMLVHIRKNHPKKSYKEYVSPNTIEINQKMRMVAQKKIKLPNSGKRKRRHQEPRKAQPVVVHEDVKEEDCSISTTVTPVRRSTRKRTPIRKFVDDDSDDHLEFANEDVSNKEHVRRKAGRPTPRKTSPSKENAKMKRLAKKDLPQTQLRTAPSSSFEDIIRKRFKHIVWREPFVALKRLTIDEVLQHSALESR